MRSIWQPVLVRAQRMRRASLHWRTGSVATWKSSRPTTTLGMPRIVSDGTRLTDEDVIHRTGEFNKSHIRMLPD